MGLGQDIARTFTIPAIDSSELNQGLKAPKSTSTNEDIPDFDLEMAEGINHLDAGAQSYFIKFQEVKAYAHSMWNRFRIDVTKPDFSRGEEGIQAHILYQKAVADVMHQGQQLTNDQKALETLQKQRAEGKIVGPIDPTQGVTDQSLGIPTTAIHPMVTEMNSKFAKGFETTQEQKAAQKDLDQARDFFTKQRDEVEAPVSQRYWDQQLAALGDARFAPKIFKPEKTDDDGINPLPERKLKRWAVLEDAAKNPKALEAHPDIDIAELNDDGNKIILTKSDDKIEVHDIGDKGFWGVLNGYIEGLPGNEDSKANSITNEELGTHEPLSGRTITVGDASFDAEVRKPFLVGLKSQSDPLHKKAVKVLQSQTGQMRVPPSLNKLGINLDVASIETNNGNIFGDGVTYTIKYYTDKKGSTDILTINTGNSEGHDKLNDFILSNKDHMSIKGFDEREGTTVFDLDPK